jgi:hypothetical protein
MQKRMGLPVTRFAARMSRAEMSFADLAALTWFVHPASGFYILSDSKQLPRC